MIQSKFNGNVITYQNELNITKYLKKRITLFDQNKILYDNELLNSTVLLSKKDTIDYTPTKNHTR